MSGGLLIGDLGGTNARFALARRHAGGFSQLRTLPCGEFATADAAMGGYLEQAAEGSPAIICLAVAGPIVNGTVRFLNNDWSVDAAGLSRRFGGATVRLLNDFEAIAHSLPLLEGSDLETVGAARPALGDRKSFTVGVLGPGTGLGMAGLVRRGGQPATVVSEGGHVGFAPESRLQLEVLEVLRQRFERVSDERLLSGPGIENIYQALRSLHGAPPATASAAEIFQRARDHSDRCALETVQLFFEVLGQVAGNLALVLGAAEGVFVAGGIVRRYPELLRASGFRSGFENKGRHRSLMERVPTSLITHPQPGLLGASEVARRLDRQLRRDRGKQNQGITTTSP